MTGVPESIRDSRAASERTEPAIAFVSRTHADAREASTELERGWHAGDEQQVAQIGRVSGESVTTELVSPVTMSPR